MRTEEEEGRDAGRGKRRGDVLGGLDNLDVCTDGVHSDGTTGRTDEKNVTSAEAINDDEGPDEGANSLDHAKDSSGKETGVEPGYTNAERGPKNQEGLRDTARTGPTT